jgi:predicted DNA-binding WGR domain protein
MATLFNFRSNTKTKARTSNKIWRITRSGRFVKRRWGRAVMKSSRPKFAGHGREPLIQEFESERLAKEFVTRIIAQKIREGYDRLRRRRS